jgi:hypothetical protein
VSGALFCLLTGKLIAALADHATAYARADVIAGGVLWVLALAVLALIFSRPDPLLPAPAPAQPLVAGRPRQAAGANPVNSFVSRMSWAAAAPPGRAGARKGQRRSLPPLASSRQLDSETLTP